MSTTDQPTVTPAPVKPAESATERYARQTRNAACFVAWIVALWLVAAVIGGIAYGVHVHDVNQQNNQLSNCQSVGGTNPNC